MPSDQSPSEFMLSVLSDPATAEAAADQWALAHPAAPAGSQGSNGSTATADGAGAAAGEIKDIEGGSAGSTPPPPRGSASALWRRTALPDSLSLVTLPGEEHRGVSALAVLALQVNAARVCPCCRHMCTDTSPLKQPFLYVRPCSHRPGT